MKQNLQPALLAALILVAAQATAVPPSPPGVRAPAPVAAAAMPAVINLETTKLTKDQFDRLPASQVLEFHGHRTSVGELRSRLEIMLAHRGAGKTTAAALKAKLDAIRQRFLAAQKARISAANGQVLARLHRGTLMTTAPLATRAPAGTTKLGSAAAVSRRAFVIRVSPVKIEDCFSTGAPDSFGTIHPGAAQPGSVVSCTGVKFGEAGFAVIRGLRKADGSASDIHLVVDSWTDSGDATGNVSSAAFTIPGNLSGYRSQQATIQLTTRDGTPSNTFAVAFYPLLDREPSGELRAACSSPNNSNACGMGWAYRDNAGAPRYTYAYASGYGAAHGSDCGFFCFVNGDKGADQWTGGPLANDWVFSELDFTPDPGWPKQTLASNFVPGPGFQVFVDWSYDYGYGAAGIEYNLTVWRTGPLGVPWQ
jgi:hypothetical protein